jgi:hypothetical protein
VKAKKIQEMKCNNITSQEHHEEHQENSQCTQEILQSFLYYSQNVLQILVTRFTMRVWEREGKEWEKFWHNRVAMRIDDEMRRGRHSFIIGREARPLLDELQVSHIKGKEFISRGGHF